MGRTIYWFGWRRKISYIVGYTLSENGTER
jgi:hypothetical protein